MKVFVSGVAGLIGSHLARALLEMGEVVVGCDSMIGGYADNVPDGVQFFQTDCRDLPLVQAIMREVDVVYHCAATAYEGLSVFSPHFVVDNIVSGTAAMLSAACQNKVKRFVFLSSMARYGAGLVPFVEDETPLCPRDPYGIAKVAAEKLTRMLCETHGIEWAVAVPHNVYGPGQRYDDPYRNVAAIFANLMLQGKQPFIYGNGQQRRCFSYVEDCIGPLVTLGLPGNTASGLIVNIGPDGEFITILELAETLAGIIGVDLEPLFVPPRPCEVKDANCSAGRARKVLGFSPKVSLYGGLARMVDWIRRRGPLPFVYDLPLEIVNGETPQTWVKHLF